MKPSEIVSIKSKPQAEWSLPMLLNSKERTKAFLEERPYTSR